MSNKQITIDDPPPGVELEHCPCPRGCPPDDEEALIGCDRLHGVGGTFRVVRCKTCGLMRTDPRPTQATIGRYYSADYHPYASSRIQDDRPRNWRLVRWLLRWLLRDGSQAIPPLPPGRLLEIGSASGSFLARMAELGWEVQGIETSAEAATAARAAGFDVQVAAVEDARLPREPVDLVVGWMVLEHTHHPRAVLERLYSCTRPGGWLAMSVPNAAALEARIFGPRWYALQLPTHLTHFGPRSLRQMLDSSGWQVERIIHHRNANNLILSLAGVTLDAGFGNRLVRRLARPPVPLGLKLALWPVAQVLGWSGQSGRMTVWARRGERP